LAYLSVEIPINKRWLIWALLSNKKCSLFKFWQRSHEAIICRLEKTSLIFNRDEVREPYTEGFLNGAAGKVRKGTIGRYSKDGKEPFIMPMKAEHCRRDVIKIPALAGGAGMNERWFILQDLPKNQIF